MQRIVRPFLAALLLGIAYSLSGAAPTSATYCPLLEPEEGMAEADSAFLGTVTATSDRDRVAAVAIDEVWSGPDLPETVEVVGTEFRGANVSSDLDRTYAVGARMLFMLELRGGVLTDHACTGTRFWEEDLARARPSNARSPTILARPTTPASDQLPVVLPVVAAGLIGLVVFGSLVLAGRRQRPRRDS